MSQYDFGNLESPVSGTELINTHLEPWRNALHSMHSGSSRPSYATAGMIWHNTTTNPWVVNVFDGADDISIGTVDTTTNLFTPSNATPAADSITNAMLAEVAANTVKTNNTASTANPSDLAFAASTIFARLASGNIVAATVAQIKTLLAYAYADISGLGTAAQATTGTSGATVPLCNGANTWSSLQTMSAGVNFGQDTLAYFDIGTFTPVAEGSTAAGSGANYTQQHGRYIRIGSVVWINIYIDYTTLSGATGNYYITGLPFAQANNGVFYGMDVAFIKNMTTPASSIVTAVTRPNTTRLEVYSTPVAGGSSALMAIDAANGIIVSGWYEV